MEKVSQPSYSFTVDSADFLVMDEFEAFKNALSLGKRVYLKLDNGRVLTPLLLGFSHTFDEKSGLTLEFSNKFTSNDENDRLVTLLEQSVSMGKKLDMNRETYVAFVGSHANTAIHDFMNGSLDVAKNSILSTTGQAISWDENGLRLRKWNSDRTGYEDEQIWMKDNLIVFTEDAWQHAKMAIGHIHDEELGDLWGVIADSIVGKLLAGENLIIVGTDATGKKTLFRVDGSGMYAYNSRFWMESTNGGAFAIDPSFGLGLGQGNPFVVGDDGTIVPKCIDAATGELKLDKDGFPAGMNLWAGMDGQVYVRGNIYATDGVFNGKVYATDGEFKGIVKATDFQTQDGKSMMTNGKFDSKYLDLMGIDVKDENGNTVMTIDGTNGITIQKGSIKWSNVSGRPSIPSIPSYIQSTYIDSVEIRSPTIKANDYYIYPYDEKDYTGSFNIYGMFDGRQNHIFRIVYNGLGDSPDVSIYSPAHGPISIGAEGDWVNIEGTLNLSGLQSIQWGKHAPTAVFG